MTALSPVGRQIQEALAIFLRWESSTIRPDHHLREDLGLDSLTTFELLYELEKAFDLEMPNEDLPGLQTLGDIVNYVEAQVHSSRPAANASGAPRSKDKPRKPKTVTSSTKKAPDELKPQADTKRKKRSSESTAKTRPATAKSKGKKP